MLATSALRSHALAGGADWVVATRFAGLLRAHPGINRLWEYDRTTGLRGWIALCRELHAQNFDVVHDLHGSLRTRLARMLFLFWGGRRIRWHRVKKQRLRLYGYFLFKALWPRVLRPAPHSRRFALACGGNGAEKPDLGHLVGGDGDMAALHSRLGILRGQKYFCIMPGARWDGKCWNIVKFAEAAAIHARSSGSLPVITGERGDARARELVRILEALGVRHVDASGRLELAECAGLLRGADFYLGNDTGLFHIAEAVGTRAVVTFGPTAPDMGFGPWQGASRAAGARLWCRPCGKDGRFCFRPFRRHYCMKRLDIQTVVRAIGGADASVVSLHSRLYGFFARNTLGRLFDFFARRGPGAGDAGILKNTISSAADGGDGRAWFHAASVGELESLWNIILEWTRSGRDAVVTVLSPSARRHVDRLKAESGGRILFAGYSPVEGGWDEWLGIIGPHVFVTAKYEAWPGLWSALAARDIRLVIVGAKARRSLKIARYMCLLLEGRLPRMSLVAALDADAGVLACMFPDASVSVAADPRWDRVVQRSRSGSERAKNIVGLFNYLPHPWGVMGSVWMDDLEVWKGHLPLLAGDGTLWVVPHHVDGPNVEKMAAALGAEGFVVELTSANSGGRGGSVGAGGKKHAVVVDEMGFLSELYASADWAYVGGGFSKGVHSTIEPSVHGMPVACGPKNALKFPEIEVLLSCGQLRILRGSRDIGDVIAFLTTAGSGARDGWKALVRSRLGAATKVTRLLFDAQCVMTGPR